MLLQQVANFNSVSRSRSLEQWWWRQRRRRRRSRSRSRRRIDACRVQVNPVPDTTIAIAKDSCIATCTPQPRPSVSFLFCPSSLCLGAFVCAAFTALGNVCSVSAKVSLAVSTRPLPRNDRAKYVERIGKQETYHAFVRSYEGLWQTDTDGQLRIWYNDRVLCSKCWVCHPAVSSCSIPRANNNNNIYLTAIGLSPGGSGFKHIYKYLTLCY